MRIAHQQTGHTDVSPTGPNIRNKVMKNQCGDYSYFSLNALSYLTTLLIGIAFGLSVAIAIFHMSENVYQNFHHLIYLIVALVVAAIIFRGVTLYFGQEKNEKLLTN